MNILLCIVSFYLGAGAGRAINEWQLVRRGRKMMPFPISNRAIVAHLITTALMWPFLLYHDAKLLHRTLKQNKPREEMLNNGPRPR